MLVARVHFEMRTTGQWRETLVGLALHGYARADACACCQRSALLLRPRGCPALVSHERRARIACIMDAILSWCCVGYLPHPDLGGATVSGNGYAWNWRPTARVTLSLSLSALLQEDSAPDVFPVSCRCLPWRAASSPHRCHGHAPIARQIVERRADYVLAFRTIRSGSPQMRASRDVVMALSGL